MLLKGGLFKFSLQRAPHVLHLLLSGGTSAPTISSIFKRRTGAPTVLHSCISLHHLRCSFHSSHIMHRVDYYGRLGRHCQQIAKAWTSRGGGGNTKGGAARCGTLVMRGEDVGDRSYTCSWVQVSLKVTLSSGRDSGSGGWCGSLGLSMLAQTRVVVNSRPQSR